MRFPASQPSPCGNAGDTRREQTCLHPPQCLLRVFRIAEDGCEAIVLLFALIRVIRGQLCFSRVR
jgi:hypothetical protein